jgi:uncharacterized protein
MADYFLDTSALIKRYATEAGSTWINDLCSPAAAHSIAISQATLVETVAALCRKAADGAISVADREQLIVIFRRDVRRSYSLERVTSAVYTSAADLCRSHSRLRAYDAVQLACALALRDRLAPLGLSPIFVCADNDLLRFATSEGLGVENPSHHP